MFSLVAARFARTDEYEQQGFDSPIQWIKATCHMSGGAAADRVCVGQQLERLANSAAAVTAGEIGFAHVAHIARTAARVGEKLDEARLLRHARKESVFKFHNTCLHAEHAADPKGFVDEEKEGVEACRLNWYTADDGTLLVKAVLDKVGGAALRTALEPLARRAGKDDDRDRERRLADALVDLAMHALDNGAPAQRPHLQVTTSLETLHIIRTSVCQVKVYTQLIRAARTQALCRRPSPSATPSSQSFPELGRALRARG